MQAMTPYELEQAHNIAGWKAERPKLLGDALTKVTRPLASLAEDLIPPETIKESLKNAYESSEVWSGKNVILEKAGVNQVGELRHKDLALSDRLADERIVAAAESAMYRGASSGAGGVLGVAFSVPVMIAHALGTIHSVGSCYGFSVHEPHEKHFVLGVLLIASADDMQTKQHAIVNLRRLEDMLVQETLEELAEEAVADVIIESAGLAGIPMFGILAGAMNDAAFAEHVGQVAKRCFQERWLRANDKVSVVKPDTAYARSTFQRVADGVAIGSYWTTYTVSLAVTYPTLLLVSFVPLENSVGHGLRDGRDAARQDMRRLRDRKEKTSEMAAPPASTLAAGFAG